MDFMWARPPTLAEEGQMAIVQILTSETIKSLLYPIIYDEHPDHVMGKLNNYKLGIVKVSNPMALDRSEDYFVELTNAEVSLNRYKVTTY